MGDRVTVIRERYKKRLDLGEIIPCGLCGEPIPRRPSKLQRVKYGGKGGLSMDHIIERSKGGSNRVDNLQPTHLRCNLDKSSPKNTRLKEKLLHQAEAESSRPIHKDNKLKKEEEL